MTRRRKHREALELASFLRRMGRALVRRSGEGDVLALVALVETVDYLEGSIVEAAQALYYDSGLGLTWGDIGRELGISRQAARQRFECRGRKRA